MKFTCAYCGIDHKDDSGRPSLKICRPSNFIVAYFTFCNMDCHDLFLVSIHLIREIKK